MGLRIESWDLCARHQYAAFQLTDRTFPEGALPIEVETMSGRQLGEQAIASLTQLLQSVRRLSILRNR